ncbi:hypothetical protein KCP74_03065 [Salmonella enterica subsp. enterica]|nr:hypothetical protein KCP74_03065 [Salmonella enterica subsp. enterica]
MEYYFDGKTKPVSSRGMRASKVNMEQYYGICYPTGLTRCRKPQCSSAAPGIYEARSAGIHGAEQRDLYHDCHASTCDAEGKLYTDHKIGSRSTISRKPAPALPHRTKRAKVVAESVNRRFMT